jgi:hypothetical protein
MVREGIVLGHLISERGIEVDKSKVEVIEQLPPPKPPSMSRGRADGMREKVGPHRSGDP